MPTGNMPIYLNWGFWAVIVAAIAVVLSQISPLYLLFRRAKLDIELYSRIHISHRVGNPNVQLHLIISNIGGRNVRIKNISVTIKRDGKRVAVLPAQNYLQIPSDTRTLLFTSFPLKPKEEWAHTINFLNYFSRTDEKKYRTAESKLKQDIAEKQKLPENKGRFVEAEHNLISPFLDMFNEMFVWNPGEYELGISVTSSRKSANIEKSYRFTMFESDSGELLKVKDDYRLGDGIFWDSGNHPGVIVQIVEA
jgi:hypothetical protein